MPAFQKEGAHASLCRAGGGGGPRDRPPGEPRTQAPGQTGRPGSRQEGCAPVEGFPQGEDLCLRPRSPSDREPVPGLRAQVSVRGRGSGWHGPGLRAPSPRPGVNHRAPGLGTRHPAAPTPARPHPPGLSSQRRGAHSQPRPQAGDASSARCPHARWPGCKWHRLRGQRVPAAPQAARPGPSSSTPCPPDAAGFNRPAPRPPARSPAARPPARCPSGRCSRLAPGPPGRPRALSGPSGRTGPPAVPPGPARPGSEARATERPSRAPARAAL